MAAEQAGAVRQARADADAKEAALRDAHTELARAFAQQRPAAEGAVAPAAADGPGEQRHRDSSSDSSSDSSDAPATATARAEAHSAKAEALGSSGGGDVAAAAAAEAEAKRKAAALEAGNKKLVERVTSLVRTYTDRVGSFK